MVNIYHTKPDLDVIERKNYNATKWITWNYEDRKLEPHPSLKPTLLELWPLDNETACHILYTSIGCWDWCRDLEEALNECLASKTKKGEYKGNYNETYWNEYWKEHPDLKKDDVSKGIELFDELSDGIQLELDSIEFWDLDSKSRRHLHKFLQSAEENHLDFLKSAEKKCKEDQRMHEFIESELLRLLRKANLPENLLLG
jgi:hypothetical protein